MLGYFAMICIEIGCILPNQFENISKLQFDCVCGDEIFFTTCKIILHGDLKESPFFFIMNVRDFFITNKFVLDILE